MCCHSFGLCFFARSVCGNELVCCFQMDKACRARSWMSWQREPLNLCTEKAASTETASGMPSFVVSEPQGFKTFYEPAKTTVVLLTVDTSLECLQKCSREVWMDPFGP